MQILLLGLFVALFLHDASTTLSPSTADASPSMIEALPGDAWPHLGPLPVLLLVLLPKLSLALIYQTAAMRTRRRLGQSAGQRTLNRLEQLTAALPMILLALFVFDLWIGALRVVRMALRHVVLIDELVVMLPTLSLAVFAWWAYYPVDRRLREAAIFRQADEGRPIYPLLTRSQYVSMQMRHQFGLLLLPLLGVYAWSEAITLLGPNHRALLSETVAQFLAPVGILLMFVLAPLVIRYIWHTVPLAEGEVRGRMIAMCELHRVRVRELLLWRTGSGMINAAVTGLIRQVRYILLSDGLLDQLPPRAVEAVMAHELAHVKLHHMLWMVAVLLATLGLTEYAANAALDRWVEPTSQTTQQTDTPWFDLANPQTQMFVMALPVFGFSLWVFGWVSRRIERQADVFAARHLAQSSEARQYDDAGRLVFDADSVHTMIHALQRVADLNHSPVHRRSWRHGSIAWRQQHLRSLIASPVHDTPVDRVLVRIKVAACLALLILALASTNG